MAKPEDVLNLVTNLLGVDPGGDCTLAICWTENGQAKSITADSENDTSRVALLLGQVANDLLQGNIDEILLRS